MAIAYAPNDDEQKFDQAPPLDAVTGGAGAVAQAPVPPPPAPGGDLSVEQLAAAAAAPPVPPDAPLPTPGAPPVAAPGSPPPAGDAVDQVLAANPIPPAPPPPRTGPVDVQKEAGAAYDQQGQLVDQAVAAEQKEGAAKQEIAQDESKIADDRVALAQQAQREQQAAIDNANKRSQAWLDRADEETAKLMQMKPQDYWANKSTGERVIAGLSVLFGAAGRTDNSTNPGLKIVNDAIEKDFRLQQAQIDKQAKNVAAAQGQYETALTDKQQALADNRLKMAAAFDVTAAQLISMKMKKGATLEQAQTDKDVVSLRQKANAVRMDTLNTIHQWNVQDEQLKIGHERAAAMAARKKGAGGGGGGGGGGRAMDAYEAMQKAAEQPGANEAQVISAGLAAGLNQKLAAKEGSKIFGSFKKGVNEIDKQFDPIQDQAVGTARTLGPVRTLSQVEGVRHGMEEAIKSGDKGRLKAATVKAMEQAGTLMSGGKLTNAQIKILHELESKQDQLTSEIGKWTGEPVPGKGLVKRLMDLIEGAGDEYAAQIADVRERGMKQFLGPGGIADTEQKKRRFLNLNAGAFGSVRWKGKPVFEEVAGGGHGDEGHAAPTGPAHGGRGGGPKKLSDRDAALKIKAQQTVNDPKADPALKKSAQAFLDRIGG